VQGTNFADFLLSQKIKFKICVVSEFETNLSNFSMRTNNNTTYTRGCNA
jgi:hypothetical protein